jgi:spore cortex biosynthesis protein YabQ
VNVSIGVQVWQAAAALLLGSALGVVYDLFRTLTLNNGKKTALSSFAVAALDILFWLFAIPAVFWYAMTAGEGQLRLYSLVLIVLGGFIYKRLAKNKVRVLLSALLKAMKQIISVAVTPLCLLLQGIGAVIKTVWLHGFTERNRRQTVTLLKRGLRKNIRKEREIHEKKKHRASRRHGNGRRSLYSIRGADDSDESNSAQQNKRRNRNAQTEERAAADYQSFHRTGYRL